MAGNLEALRLNQRYLHQDLNRVWTRENLDHLHYGNLDLRHTEYYEMSVIYNHLQEIISNTKEKLFVIDLHTTSSPTIPFIVTNNSQWVQNFITKFPMPVITGLSGFLDGTLLAYINDLGHVGMAYEAGQHLSYQSLVKHESFIWLSLYQAGVLPNLDSSIVNFHRKTLQEELATRNNHFKLISRYKIRAQEQFSMHHGYVNFQKIVAGEELAKNHDGPICAPYDGYIFMPLYQAEGDDGFFIIKPE
ncbi:MAG: hypothetical protein ACI8ZN_001256 [Bacteroidia bacterium]|jgi:hypothetical protein